jgi:hypothetical protein
MLNPGKPALFLSPKKSRFRREEEDGIDFLSVTHQEIIARLARRFRDEHRDYIDYTERNL